MRPKRLERHARSLQSTPCQGHGFIEDVSQLAHFDGEVDVEVEPDDEPQDFHDVFASAHIRLGVRANDRPEQDHQLFLIQCSACGKVGIERCLGSLGRVAGL